MATRVTQTTPNRQSGYGGGNYPNGSMDVGLSAVTQMAREDTRWFVIAVIFLSVVLFLALPLSLLVYADSLRLQAQIRADAKASARKLERLQKELEDLKSQQEEKHNGNP